MNYYLQAFQRFADFSGRSRRSEFWYFYLFHILAVIVAAIIDGVTGKPIFLILYALVSFIPTLAVIVRRLHDIGKSGWYYFISLVPLVGGIILLVWLATDTQPGPNQWGEDPKGYLGDDISDHLVD